MKKLLTFSLSVIFSLNLFASEENADVVLRDWVDSPLNDCILSKGADITARSGDNFLVFLQFKPELVDGVVSKVSADFLTRNAENSSVHAYSITIGTLDRWYPVVEENNTKLGYGTKAINPIAALKEFNSDEVIAEVDLSGCFLPSNQI